MKKKIIIAAVALLMVIVGIAVYLYNSIDQIVEAAIEKHGSRVVGTEVSVGSVHISLKSGRGTIRDVEIENPDGFSSDHILTLDEITVDIDVRSLNRDPIVVDEVIISAPKVRAEMNEVAQTNIGAIKRAIETYQGTAAPKERKQDAGFEKRIVIEKFVFQEGGVHLDATKMGFEPAVDLEMPPVRLSNVGGSNGDTPDVIAKTVSRAFFAAVADVVADEAKRRYGEQAKEKAKEKATDAAKKAIEDILN